MEAIIGRYRTCMQEKGLVLRHPSGIDFDLTVAETLGLLDFLKVYKQALLLKQQERETDPRLERIVIEQQQGD